MTVKANATTPIRLFVELLDQRKLPDETRVSIGWWTGDDFCAQIKYDAGELRALVTAADLGPTVRAACRARHPLDGADAQALEHALTITEREREKALASSHIDRQLADANLESLRIVGEQRDAYRVAGEASAGAHAATLRELAACREAALRAARERDEALLAALHALGESDWTPNDVKDAGPGLTLRHIENLVGFQRDQRDQREQGD